MSIADRIAQRLKDDRRVITVPEWGEDGVPLSVFVKPITAGDINRLQRKHKDFLNNMTVEGMVELIIMKAEDSEGVKMFTIEDKPVLMREQVGVIADVAGKMFGDIDSIEDHEKN